MPNASSLDNTEPMSPIVPPEALIEVHMNNPAANAPYHYPTNFISTSKYNLFTFVPMNLFEQFRRVSNFYFLVNVVISLIPNVSPINPLTAIMPLVFVLGVAAVKDGYEDYKRHQSDNKANSVLAHVLRNGAFMDIPSREVQVGDIIRIENGEEFHADIILLSSSEGESAAYIDTCNLDGETNLKNRRGIEITWDLNSVDSLTKSNVTLRCKEPSPALLHWNGVLIVNGAETAVGLDQFLYRSAVLKNTKHVYGVVAYAGIDTKMYRNLEKKPPKLSGLDRKLNKLILTVLLAQNCALFTMCGYGVVFNQNAMNNRDAWAIQQFINNELSGAALFFWRYLTNFILMSYMIPISLFVTIELCKVSQAKLMEWDHHMKEFMNDRWEHCKPNTSNLNEQLSQVKYIFTDKTGTLTENKMVFLCGDILGVPIQFPCNPDSVPNTPEVDRYFKILSLCHTIQPFADKKHPGKYQYEGSSPDEAALVGTAVFFGYELVARQTRSITIMAKGRRIEYEILDTLEFTADRKMMSIILRDPDTKQILLLTKGADSNVFARLSKTDTQTCAHREPLSQTLSLMASKGLRTLVVGTRAMAPEEYALWKGSYENASKAMVNRAQGVDAVCLQAERDLILVGCTAIEDKLQDQVPETLQFFLKAGVVVWMLTGDKRETAVTIGATSALVDPQKDFVQHVDCSAFGDAPSGTTPEDIVHAQLTVALQACKAKKQKVTIVIDGITLQCVTKVPLLSDLFLEISQLVSSAICCRLTPIQKAQIVKMFQTATGATALAVGDGANDVSMIQEGKVGVGIIGVEGAQATLAADYAIPRFKHLKRLCMVHGRYAFYRNALCICFSFYKNICLALTQFYFSFYAGGSGQTLYNGWLLAFFNFSFTSVPPLGVGIFEKDIDEDVIMLRPDLYPPLAEGLYFDIKTIGRWFLEAVLHSCILFFATDQLFVKDGVLASVGTLLMTCLVFLVLLKLGLHIRHFTGIQAACLTFSVAFYVIFIVSYAAIDILFGDSTMYYVAYHMLGSARFWFYLLTFLIGLLVAVDLAIMTLQRHVWPTVRDLAQKKSSSEQGHKTISQRLDSAL